MKIIVRCPSCHKEAMDNVFKLSFDVMPISSLEPMEALLYGEALALNDSGCYEFKCKNDHHNIVILNNYKYELFFDAGFAYLDRQEYREAIMNFSLSMEMYYHFFIDRVIFSKKQPTPEAVDLHKNSWKDLQKQSERQRGAFVILYTETFGELPFLLSSELTQLRNRATHAGWIPDLEKTHKYGEAVFKLISSANEKLAKIMPLDVFPYTCEFGTRLTDADKKWGASTTEISRQTLLLPTTLSGTFESDKSYESCYTSFIRNKDMHYEF